MPVAGLVLGAVDSLPGCGRPACADTDQRQAGAALVRRAVGVRRCVRELLLPQNPRPPKA